MQQTPIAVALLALSACAPSLAYNRTFLVSEELKLGQSGYASLKSTGETVDLSPIRAQEKSADRVLLLKVRGADFVVGDGFQKLWRLWPDGNDKAHYKPVDLAPGTQGFRAPSLEVSGSCALLRWTRDNTQAKAYVTSDGDVDERKCGDD